MLWISHDSYCGQAIKIGHIESNIFTSKWRFALAYVLTTFTVASSRLRWKETQFSRRYILTVALHATNFSYKNSSSCPQRVFMCFVRISEQDAIVCPHCSKILFSEAFAKLRKATIIGVVISVRLSAWNISSTTTRISMKFDTWVK